MQNSTGTKPSQIYPTTRYRLVSFSSPLHSQPTTATSSESSTHSVTPLTHVPTQQRSTSTTSLSTTSNTALNRGLSTSSARTKPRQPEITSTNPASSPPSYVRTSFRQAYGKVASSPTLPHSNSLNVSRKQSTTQGGCSGKSYFSGS